MTTLKSLEARLKKIPEPDLAKLRSEINYQMIKQFSSEQREVMRELLRHPDNADRNLTLEEMAPDLGISAAEIEAKRRKVLDAMLAGSEAIESDRTTARPASGAKPPATQPAKTTNPPRPNAPIAAPPKASSAAPPPKDENDRFFEQFSLEQRLAVRQLSHDLAKAGPTIMSRAEICAALGISIQEFDMRLAKAQLPEIAPDPAIPATAPATEREAKAPPSQSTEKKTKEKKSTEKKTKKGSRPNGSIAAAPKAAGSAAPPAPTKKASPAKSPPPPLKRP